MAVGNHIVDMDLKAFIFRLRDPALADVQWIESVATLVGKKAPERWRDTDEMFFFERLAVLVPRFKRVEAISFDGDALDADKSRRCLRLTVTLPDGSEADEVLHWSPEEDHSLHSVEKVFGKLIQDHGKIALAAAAACFGISKPSMKKAPKLRNECKILRIARRQDTSLASPEEKILLPWPSICEAV